MSDLNYSRRSVLIGMGAAGAAMTSGLPAFAFGQADAEALIGKAIGDINAIINSGKSETAMYRDFEKILINYADMNGISRSVLGPPARTASNSQLSQFKSAFQTYLAEKYGARFREFIGGRVEISSTKKVNAIYDVTCVALLQGEPPFEVSFIVHERSGRFIDMQIEGISLLKSERAEIGAMYDAAGGSVDGVIKALKAL